MSAASSSWDDRRIRRATNADCELATGAVVAIDVLRAFTTAAFAFAAGAREIIPVAGVEEGLALKRRFPGALAMGEVGGYPIPGYDFGNSPTALLDVDLSGHRLIQRTSAGTQGLVRSTHAELLLASSFVCASATARYLARRSPESVTLVATGKDELRDGDEDVACADYLAALLRGETLEPTSYVRRVRESRAAAPFTPESEVFALSDVELACDIDRFDFALVVERTADFLMMRAVR